jgi:hypothetical protein
VGAVELRGDLNSHLRVFHGRFSGVGVRNSSHEVAAYRDENLDPAVAHPPDGFY